MSENINIAGQREGRYLRINSLPQPYDTPIENFNPAYRIPLSTVILESGSQDVIVGDILISAENSYYVGYVDLTSNYIYTGPKSDVGGMPGPRGLRGYPGVQGIQGESGSNGEDGFTPAIYVTSEEGQHIVEITNKDGDPTYFTINDGTGVTVSTRTIEDGNEVTFTDVNGPHTIQIMDGQDSFNRKYLPISTLPTKANEGVNYSYYITIDNIYKQSGETNLQIGDMLIYFNSQTNTVQLYPIIGFYDNYVYLDNKIGMTKVVESDILPTLYLKNTSGYKYYIDTRSSKLSSTDVVIGDLVSFGEYLYPVVSTSSNYIRLGEEIIINHNNTVIPRKQDIKEYRDAIIDCACSYIFGEVYNNCVTRSDNDRPQTDDEAKEEEDRRNNTNFFCALYDTDGKAWGRLNNHDAISHKDFDYISYYDGNDDKEITGEYAGYIKENTSGRGYHVLYCACSGFAKLCLLNIPYQESVYKMVYDKLPNQNYYTKAEMATRTRQRGRRTYMGTEMPWTVDINDNGHCYDMVHALDMAGIKCNTIFESTREWSSSQSKYIYYPKVYENILSTLESGDIIFDARSGNKWSNGAHHIMIYLKSLNEPALKSFEKQHNCTFHSVPYKDKVSDYEVTDPTNPKYDNLNYGYIIHCSTGTDAEASITKPLRVNELIDSGYTCRIFIDNLVWYVLTKTGSQSIVISAKPIADTSTTKEWSFNTTELIVEEENQILKLSQLSSGTPLDDDERPSWMEKGEFKFDWKIESDDEVTPKDFDGEEGQGSFRSSRHNPNNTFRIDTLHHYMKKSNGYAWRRIYAYKPYSNNFTSTKARDLHTKHARYVPDANLLEYPPEIVRTLRVDNTTDHTPYKEGYTTYPSGLLLHYSVGGRGGKFINLNNDHKPEKYEDGYRIALSSLNSDKRPADPSAKVGEWAAWSNYMYPITKIATDSGITYAYADTSFWDGAGIERDTQIMIPAGTNRIFIRNKNITDNSQWNNWGQWDEFIKKSDIQSNIQYGRASAVVNGTTEIAFNTTFASTPRVTVTLNQPSLSTNALLGINYSVTNTTSSKFSLMVAATSAYNSAAAYFNWHAIYEA